MHCRRLAPKSCKQEASLPRPALQGAALDSKPYPASCSRLTNHRRHQSFVWQDVWQFPLETFLLLQTDPLFFDKSPRLGLVPVLTRANVFFHLQHASVVLVLGEDIFRLLNLVVALVRRRGICVPFRRLVAQHYVCAQMPVNLKRTPEDLMQRRCIPWRSTQRNVNFVPLLFGHFLINKSLGDENRPHGHFKRHWTSHGHTGDTRVLPRFLWVFLDQHGSFL